MGQLGNLILSSMSVFAFIAGLWIARSVLPRLVGLISPNNQQLILSQPIIRTTLWLAIGSLISLPLEDIVRFLSYLVGIVLIPSQTFSTVLGLVPGLAYYAFSLLTMLLIYGIAILFYRSEQLLILTSLNAAERLLIFFSSASLVLRGIQSVFNVVFAFPYSPHVYLEYIGITGFLIEIFIGVLILGLIYIGFQLADHHSTEK
jgi:hypothetical protein